MRPEQKQQDEQAKRKRKKNKKIGRRQQTADKSPDLFERNEVLAQSELIGVPLNTIAKVRSLLNQEHDMIATLSRPVNVIIEDCVSKKNGNLTVVAVHPKKCFGHHLPDMFYHKDDKNSC